LPLTLQGVFQSITDFFNSNLTAIMIGILTSVIVLLLQTVVRTSSLALAAWLGRTGTIAPIWGFKDAKRIHIVSGSLEGLGAKTPQAILMGPDADAANECFATLRNLRPSSKLVREYSPYYPEEQLKEDMVSIGGPVNNSVTRRLMAYISEKVSFEPESGDLLDKFSTASKRYEATYDDNDVILSDYGLILKIPNPFDITREVMVLAGCDTPGVLAAARSISLNPEGKTATKAMRKSLRRFAYFRDNSFVAIVKCNVIGNEIGIPELVAFHPIQGAELRRVAE
jgi:hypothetical protein